METYPHGQPLQLLAEPRSWVQSVSRCCSLDCNALHCSGSSRILLLQLCTNIHPAHTLQTDVSLWSNARSYSPAQKSCTKTMPQQLIFKQFFVLVGFKPAGLQSLLPSLLHNKLTDIEGSTACPRFCYGIKHITVLKSLLAIRIWTTNNVQFSIQGTYSYSYRKR